MKIEALRVTNFRGLIKFDCTPKGKSVIISGPNGSGKSALVDAIDFLFTGKITRLTGTGSKELSLKDHGPHVDHDAKDAVVSADIVLPSGTKFTLERRIAQPKKPTCTPNPTPEISAALTLAERGYHVLSRKEILRYIAAESGTRASDIQTLLNLNEIEDLRKILVGAQKDAERELASMRQEISTQESDLARTLRIAQYSDEALLAAINASRSQLGADPLNKTGLDKAKTGVQTPATVPGITGSNPKLIESDGRQISEIFAKKAALAVRESELKSLLIKIDADPNLKKDLAHKQLLDLGVSLIDAEPTCPLCEKRWDSVEALKRHIEERRAKALAAAELQQNISAIVGEISRAIGSLLLVVPRLVASATELKLTALSPKLTVWQQAVQDWSNRLKDVPAQYPIVANQLASNELLPAEVPTWLAELGTAASAATPTVSPAQLAWDTLTRFEASWPTLSRTRLKLTTVQTRNTRLMSLGKAFEASRESILGSLYKDIEKQFADFYGLLHDDEGKTFAATFKPEGAALKLEVDFHGKGKFPPHALHSEGHQDSMGLCLYMALIRKLTDGKIDLTVLDDVVMSVDSGHRRHVCDLLADKFGNRQFFITTHDEIWARQLRNSKIGPSAIKVEFRDWTVTTGPKWREADHWNEIEKSRQAGNVPEAAAALRRELEQFFEQACDALAAKVPYNGAAIYDLGDFSQAALGELGALLGKAKSAEHSWGNRDRVAELEKYEADFAAAKTETNIDKWVINATVHFNQWGQTSKEDFAPVIQAHAKLRNCFKCAKCGSLLRLVPRKEAENVRCDCQAVNWNLLKKSKELSV